MDLINSFIDEEQWKEMLTLNSKSPEKVKPEEYDEAGYKDALKFQRALWIVNFDWAEAERVVEWKKYRHKKDAHKKAASIDRDLEKGEVWNFKPDTSTTEMNRQKKLRDKGEPVIPTMIKDKPRKAKPGEVGQMFEEMQRVIQENKRLLGDIRKDV